MNIIAYVAILAILGGLIRNLRDSYKRWLAKEKPFDKVDLFFDAAFGLVVGTFVWMGVEDGTLTKAVILLVVSSGYAGADIIDGVLKKK